MMWRLLTIHINAYDNLVQERAPPEDSEESEDDFYDAEILDELTTNRGELKLRTLSFNIRQEILIPFK